MIVQPRPDSPDGHRIGDVEVAGGVAVLGRAGEGDLVGASRNDDHIDFVGIVCCCNGLAERALAVGRVDHVEGGGDVERGRDRAVLEALEARTQGTANHAIGPEW